MEWMTIYFRCLNLYGVGVLLCRPRLNCKSVTQQPHGVILSAPLAGGN